MRWRNYKLLTGDPGYPDYPIPIPPNETLSEEVNLGWVEILCAWAGFRPDFYSKPF